MEKQDKKTRILPYVPFMIIIFLIAAAALPFASIISNKLTGLLKAKGVRLVDNADDGQLIAEFEDLTPKLLQPIPLHFQKSNIDDHGIMIRKFAIKKVSFSALAGAGIQDRLNLVFEFQGKLPNPHGLKTGFGEPVIHVYIDAPGKSPDKNVSPSPRSAPFDFGNNNWDFQVIIDGYHEQPRIFTASGELLGEGLGIYIRGQESVTLTAALPLALMGDPSRGDWTFIVITGFSDLQSLAMMAPPAQEGGAGIHQYFKTMPLRIHNPL